MLQSVPESQEYAMSQVDSTGDAPSPPSLTVHWSHNTGPMSTSSEPPMPPDLLGNSNIQIVDNIASPAHLSCPPMPDAATPLTRHDSSCTISEGPFMTFVPSSPTDFTSWRYSGRDRVCVLHSIFSERCVIHVLHRPTDHGIGVISPMYVQLT